MKLITILLSYVNNQKLPRYIYDKNFTYSKNDIMNKLFYMIEYLKKSGVKKGSKLIVSFEHDLNGIVLMAAASALGASMILNYNLESITDRELLEEISKLKYDFIVFFENDKNRCEFLENQRCKVIKAWEYINFFKGEFDKLPLVIDSINPIENFLVLFTSGSSGTPKAISISESMLCRKIAAVSNKLMFNDKSTIFMSGLLSNTTGIIFSFGAFFHNANLVIPNTRDASKWPEYIRKHEVTHIMLRPATMRILIESVKSSKIHLDCLEVVAYGAAPMPLKLLEEGRNYIKCSWIQGYGLSETFGPFVWLDEEHHKKKLYKEYSYCLGIPDDSLKVKILPIEDENNDNVGEIAVCGESLMNGYYDTLAGEVISSPKLFKTGDLGYITEDNFLVLKGRKSNTILSENGHRIYPEEIESAIREIDFIIEVLLAGVNIQSEQSYAQQPVLCVFAKETDETDKADILKHIISTLKNNFSPEKWPNWLYISKVPFQKSKNDKILKNSVINDISSESLIRITR